MPAQPKTRSREQDEQFLRWLSWNDKGIRLSDIAYHEGLPTQRVRAVVGRIRTEDREAHHAPR